MRLNLFLCSRSISASARVENIAAVRNHKVHVTIESMCQSLLRQQSPFIEQGINTAYPRRGLLTVGDPRWRPEHTAPEPSLLPYGGHER
ncbi:hypothetical protein TNIN_329121 [Trichonephila inaurata madagascariensis]|uniref:Uncharacterized protein n=1 Tax=Trichonephila inaurata madagascariensis TaxID=2747483 RepID=A0A8X7BPH1_9ARAC|nr:hypothetical protein TNIN_329121 [Trichonephila inaurata madagascariensis]